MPDPDPTLTRIAQMVREERRRQGLDQRTLALVANVAVRSVSRIENAQPTVRLDVLLRVLAALGLGSTSSVRHEPRRRLGRATVGRLDQPAERPHEYAFTYTDADRPLSLSLPHRTGQLQPDAVGAVFRGAAPEGALRDQIADAARIARATATALLADLVATARAPSRSSRHGACRTRPRVEWLDSGRSWTS